MSYVYCFVHFVTMIW